MAQIRSILSSANLFFGICFVMLLMTVHMLLSPVSHTYVCADSIREREVPAQHKYGRIWCANGQYPQPR